MLEDELDAVCSGVPVGVENESVGEVFEKKSKMLAGCPACALISLIVFRPVTLLIPVLSAFGSSTAPQLKQRLCGGGPLSTGLSPPLYFCTVAGAPQFGQGA